MWCLRGLSGVGGGYCSHPHLSWLWSKFWLKNQIFLKADINSNLFGPFSEYCSKITQKSWQKLKTYQKLLKISKISKISNFWAISTCNTSRESIFHIEFNFKLKKYDFFVKIDADHLSSTVRFSNLCNRILKLTSSMLWEGFKVKSH